MCCNFSNTSDTAYCTKLIFLNQVSEDDGQAGEDASADSPLADLLFF